MKILIVDDDPTTLAVTGALLEEHGYQVLTSERAFGTTALILQHRPDVLLLDVMMPGIDGPELARLVQSRAAKSNTSIIFFSGMDAEELESLASQIGVLGVIQKTDEHEVFVARFHELAQLHEERRGAG